MPPKQHPNKHSSYSTKTILLFVVAIFVFFMILSSVIQLTKKYLSIRNHISELKKEELELKQKKENLVSSNLFLETPEGKEKVFRDSYRLIKKGEGIVVITKDPNSNSEPEKMGTIRRFWDSILRALHLR
ncbi:MAG TPA: hypothetical protein PLQ20_02210 [Candidatus Paceibacterota bacterium]|jgi:uncharacterized protein YlxW (UPF0749 family)|nr:hypothetical protein [Candidatus Paceibacterota bacterium]